MLWIRRWWDRLVSIDYFYQLTATELRIRVASYGLTLALLLFFWTTKFVHYRPPRFRGGEGTNGDFFAIMGAPWGFHLIHFLFSVTAAFYFVFSRSPSELSCSTRIAVGVWVSLILFFLSVVCFPNIPVY